MQALIAEGHLYIAQPPIYRLKNGKQIEYIYSEAGVSEADILTRALKKYDAPDKVVQTASSGSAMGSTRGPQSMAQTPRPAANSGVPKTSAEDAASRTKPPSANETAQSWIVHYKNAQGKDTISKLTTVQVQAALKSGTLDAKAKCKKNAADQFMPIAYFPEFQKQVEGRLIKDKADRKAGDMKSLYADIDRQYSRRGWTRWIKNLMSGTYGLITLIVWLAVIFGGIAGVVLFRDQIWNTFASTVNHTQPKEGIPKAETPK